MSVHDTQPAREGSNPKDAPLLLIAITLSSDPSLSGIDPSVGGKWQKPVDDCFSQKITTRPPSTWHPPFFSPPALTVRRPPSPLHFPLSHVPPLFPKFFSLGVGGIGCDRFRAVVRLGDCRAIRSGV